MEHVKVVIAGAGFSGLAMANRLKESGRSDFVVLERAEEVGGVWELNTYPGCACDVPSHLYSLSFAPNPEWSHTYSAQPEIREYLRRTADRFGLRAFIRTGIAVESATWSETDSRWTLETSAGTITCEVFIPSAEAASRYRRGRLRMRSIKETVTVGRIITPKRIPPVSHDFPQPRYFTKKMKPKIPNRIEGTPFST